MPTIMALNTSEAVEPLFNQLTKSVNPSITAVSPSAKRPIASFNRFVESVEASPDSTYSLK